MAEAMENENGIAAVAKPKQVCVQLSFKETQKLTIEHLNNNVSKKALSSSAAQECVTDWCSVTSGALPLVCRVIFLASKSKSLRAATFQMATQYQRDTYAGAVNGKFPTKIQVPDQEIVKTDASPTLCELVCSNCSTKCKATPEGWPTSLALPLELYVKFNTKEPTCNCLPSSCYIDLYLTVEYQPVQTRPTLLRELYDGVLSDVILRVGQQDLKTHRCVLAANSEVFRRMFEMNSKERKTGIVEIVDATPEAMQTALSFMYGQELGPVDSELLFQLLAIANKYMLHDLKTICEEGLSQDTKIDALQLLKVADDLNAQKMKEAVISRITGNGEGSSVDESTAKRLVRSNPDAVVELLMSFKKRKSS